MKLYFIYGPPASGKLTIAEKLSEKTGVPLFHNHLSRDIVKDIYRDELGANYSLVDKIRRDVFEYCAKQGTDLIFTFVYGGSDDDENVKGHIDSIEKNNGEVVFIELTTNKTELLERVGSESRKRYKKLLDPAVLDKFLDSIDNLSIPYVESLKVDTSVLSPDEASDYIARELSI